MRNVIVIGSGPAGLTAALYTARASLAPLVIEGPQPGGQLILTTTIENFPGFPEGILGSELMDAMRQQAGRFGAEFVSGEVDAVDFTKRPFRISIDGTWHESRSVIVATGATAKLLGLESERALIGRGVSTCATCDGFFFRGKSVAVVGGGDAAVEEAIFLTKFASRVTLVHRRDELRASKVLQDRARANAKIQFQWNSVVREVLDVSEGKVTGLRLADVKTQEETLLPCDGMFVAIGHNPNTAVFAGQLATSNGYLQVHRRTQTSVPGVFAAGDVQDALYRQAITAAASGCMAAIDCEKWLEAE